MKHKQTNMSRKLASLQVVSKITPIKNADKIEVAHIGFWEVVVGKNEFAVNSLVIFFEIDSWIPCSLIPLGCDSPKIYNGIEGTKLRTVKIRGTISQGLIASIANISKAVPDFDIKVNEAGGFIEGTDVTDILGITKWEEIDTNIKNFMTKGNFPLFVPKTSQPRIQNLSKVYDQLQTMLWEVTEKCDGSSMTVYYKKNTNYANTNTNPVSSVSPVSPVSPSSDLIVEGVCSRTLDLKMETVYKDKTTVNSFWRTALQAKLLEKLRDADLSIALQGEIIGAGVGGNIYKLQTQEFLLFDIYDIDAKRYYTPAERQHFAKKYEIKHVPILFNDYKLSSATCVEDLLLIAEGKSVLNKQTEREGLVFKYIGSGGIGDDCGDNDSIKSFKVINNRFLLKL